MTKFSVLALIGTISMSGCGPTGKTRDGSFLKSSIAPTNPASFIELHSATIGESSPGIASTDIQSIGTVDKLHAEMFWIIDPSMGHSLDGYEKSDPKVSFYSGKATKYSASEIALATLYEADEQKLVLWSEKASDVLDGLNSDRSLHTASNSSRFHAAVPQTQIEARNLSFSVSVTDSVYWNFKEFYEARFEYQLTEREILKIASGNGLIITPTAISPEGAAANLQLSFKITSQPASAPADNASEMKEDF